MVVRWVVGGRLLLRPAETNVGIAKRRVVPE